MTLRTYRARVIDNDQTTSNACVVNKIALVNAHEIAIVDGVLKFYRIRDALNKICVVAFAAGQWSAVEDITDGDSITEEDSIDDAS